MGKRQRIGQTVMIRNKEIASQKLFSDYTTIFYGFLM